MTSLYCIPNISYGVLLLLLLLLLLFVCLIVTYPISILSYPILSYYQVQDRFAVQVPELPETIDTASYM